MSNWKFKKLEVKGYQTSNSATTNTNSYGEHYTESDLKALAEQSVGMLVYHEHRYYSLPIGRTIKAEIVSLENDQLGCKTTNEFYVDPDNIKGKGFSVAGTPARKK